MSDPLDMVFISAHPNGVAQCLRSRSPVPGQTASSRRPAIRRGTRPRVRRPASSRTGRARPRRPPACRRACRPMTGTATRRWPPTSPTWTRAGPGSRRSGRSRARPPPSAWATPLTWTWRSWPRWWARTGSAARCSPGTGPPDAMRPGPVLAALTEQAAGDLGRLTDNQVIGAMSAARRLAARAAWLELTAVAEFTRRREAQLADATAREGAARLPGRGVPRRRARHGTGHLAERGPRPDGPGRRPADPAAPHLGRAGRRADRRIPGPADLAAHPAPDRR